VGALRNASHQSGIRWMKKGLQGLHCKIEKEVDFRRRQKLGEWSSEQARQRAKAALAANEKRFQKYIEKMKRELDTKIEQWKRCAAVRTSKLTKLEKEVRSLRRKNLNL
jgi:hypothetical protein